MFQRTCFTNESYSDYLGPLSFDPGIYLNRLHVGCEWISHKQLWILKIKSYLPRICLACPIRCQCQLLGTATTLIRRSIKWNSLLPSSIFTALLAVIQLLAKRVPSDPSLSESIIAIVSLSYKAEYPRALAGWCLMCWHLHSITPPCIGWWLLLYGDAFTRPHLMIDTWTFQ